MDAGCRAEKDCEEGSYGCWRVERNGIMDISYDESRVG